MCEKMAPKRDCPKYPEVSMTRTENGEFRSESRVGTDRYMKTFQRKAM